MNSSRLAAALTLVAVTAAPHVGATEDREGAEGLMTDLERIVVAYDADWFVDEDSLEDALPTTMESVCRATDGARSTALLELEGRLAELGDPRVLYEEADRELTDEVEDALELERQVRLLERAMGRAELCPFYVTPKPSFHGIQSDRHRFFLSIETGGVVQFRRTPQDVTFGGGGTGRVLLGKSWNRFSLLIGPEFGGGALFEENDTADEGQQLRVNYHPAVPVVFRFRRVNWHYELETGPVGLFQYNDTNISWGGRVGLGVGLWALRTRGLLPWAGLAVAYEYYVESGGRPQTHFFRGGLRVGFSWVP